nr:MAG TPA: hypothetical protein [Caudoviricetes sp.]
MKILLLLLIFGQLKQKMFIVLLLPLMIMTKL